MKIRISLVAAILVVGVIHLNAATIPVTSIADNGAAGTLRVALASAGNGDTIDASGVSGTILLTSGELLVTNSVTILGPGPGNLAVDGNAASRVFHIGSNTVVSISSLTVTNGSLSGSTFENCCGAGIFNDHSTLTISNSSLSANSARNGNGGGIYNSGFLGNAILQIADSTLSGNSGAAGGGLFSVGILGSVTVTIANSTLSDNSAFSGGGGIFNQGGTLTIANSTLSGNSASFGSSGGGIYNDGRSGGSAALTIANSTLSSNSAVSTFSGSSGGGIYNDGRSGGSAALTIANSTLSGNSAIGAFDSGGGGGIFNNGGLDGSATLDIGNTILETGASGVNVTNDSGTVTSLGYNLSSDDGGGFLTATGDQINTDPMLGPLQNNGGLTFTHALSATSPAIDAGDPNFTPPPDFDQRGPGFPRVVNGRIDIGAFEVQSVAVADSDGDGVPDAIDECADTPRGAIVDATGCSIAQLVPCDGPQSGGKWKNHGQYVSAVTHEADKFLAVGLISGAQKGAIVAKAAQSSCGK